jgi:hypothetical protein
MFHPHPFTFFPFLYVTLLGLLEQYLTSDSRTSQLVDLPLPKHEV